MPARFAASRLLIASHNAGKVREIGELMKPFSVDVVSAGELDLPEPVEDGDSFAANAIIKAEAAAQGSGLWALSDDSGLAVDALDGAPGIHSARWAGPEKDFAAAMATLANKLDGVSDPRAHFVCALPLAGPDGGCEVYEGRVFGRLVFPPRGERGFGYDPIFVPDGYDMTFGEMEPAEKHAISHRAEAFGKLIAARFSDVGSSK